MNFTSHHFLFYFLPFFLLILWAIPRPWVTVRNAALLLISCVFYGWLDMRFLGWLLLSGIFNYVMLRGMSRRTDTSEGRVWLIWALGINLGGLGIFKYTLFWGESLNGALNAFGMGTVPLSDWMWPVGVSFYTFKAISVCVDTYRTGQSPGSFLTFLCYLSFFPQVLSGPIQRYGTTDPAADTIPSFREQLMHGNMCLTRFSQGAALFMLGFAKKILLADAVGSAADTAFAARDPGALDAWFGAFAYTFQLYFDFSAYSEMAIGLGLMMGFVCTRNFNAPYRAVSVTDFWRCWHISLSGWFRDYLYIPLGGNRRGTARSYGNLAAVFLLCGLWHGAAWTFVLWGLYHGALLVLERALGRRPLYHRLPKTLQIAATFVLISMGWVVFRSPTLAEALHRLTIMVTGATAQGGASLVSGQLWAHGPVMIMAICAILAFQPRQGCDWVKDLTWCKMSGLIGLFALALATLFASSFTSFLYFQF